MDEREETDLEEKAHMLLAAAIDLGRSGKDYSSVLRELKMILKKAPRTQKMLNDLVASWERQGYYEK